MRSKFPFLWAFQLLLLTVLGLMSLFFPYVVLQFKRGQLAPEAIEKPTRALNEWVLGLESIPAPDETVRQFFKDHNSVAHANRNIWTPGDPSLVEYEREAKEKRWADAATVNRAWEQFTQWLLMCTPAPPASQGGAIRDWIGGIDEVPAPSIGLRKKIAEQQEAMMPPKELRMMILDAKQNLPISWEMAAEQTRMSAPCILGAAMFTLFGLLTPSIRRPLARVFVAVFLFWTVAALESSLGSPGFTVKHSILLGGMIFAIVLVLATLSNAPGKGTARMLWLILSAWWIALLSVAVFSAHEQGSVIAQKEMMITTTVMAAFGIINAYYWLVGNREDPPQDNAGIAQRRPPQLWTIWMMQFLLLFVSGCISLGFPHEIARLIAGSNFDYLATDVVDDSIRTLGAWTIALGLFSYFALGVARDWIWQGVCVLFIVVFTVLAVGTIVHGMSGKYSIFQYSYGLHGFIFVPAFVLVLWKHDPWSTENVERVRKEDWSVADLSVGPGLLWKTILTGRRALCREGVAGEGQLTVLETNPRGEFDQEGVPPSGFFNGGDQFAVQVRFSNRTQADDAAMDIRGCAVRLSNGAESPLDLLFVTGAYAPMSHLLDFRRIRAGNLKRAVANHKVIREGMAAGMRRAPESYAVLTYHHQLTLEWTTPEAVHYLVRFRMVPLTDQSANQPIAEALLGLPDDYDLRHLWKQKRRPDNGKTRDYLRRELHIQLIKGVPVRFQLQAQFHRPQPEDSLDWYDASIEWDTRSHQWYPLADISLDKPLSAQECEYMHFDPSNLPPSLSVPRTESVINVYDPRSLASSRHRIASVLGTMRRRRRNARNATAAKK